MATTSALKHFLKLLFLRLSSWDGVPTTAMLHLSEDTHKGQAHYKITATVNLQPKMTIILHRSHRLLTTTNHCDTCLLSRESAVPFDKNLVQMHQ